MKKPIDDGLVDLTNSKPRERLYRSWNKAIDRLDDDPDGAVTAARSFLEAVCKNILDTVSVTYATNADLSQLLRLVRQELKVSAKGQPEHIERQFYSGANQIVQSLVELRNHVGDAHGKSNAGLQPSFAQAELAVNVAGAVGSFLLRRLDSHLASTRRLNSSGHAVLRFDKTTVWRLVDHAQNSPEHKLNMRERKPKPAIWLVADAGIYLMSNGKPEILHNGLLKRNECSEEQLLLVAHAEGCGPLDQIEDWTPLQEAMSGGDDFVETIPLKVVKQALERCDRDIIIVSSDSLYKVMADTEFDELNDEALLD